MSSNAVSQLTSARVAADQVVYAMYDAIDTGHASRAAPFFADDAVWDHPSRALTGAREIGAFLDNREGDSSYRTVHVLTNVRVNERSSGEYAVDSVVFVYHADGKTDEWRLQRIARMRQIIRSIRGKWRIAYHGPQPDTASDVSHPPA